MMEFEKWEKYVEEQEKWDEHFKRDLHLVTEYRDFMVYSSPRPDPKVSSPNDIEMDVRTFKYVSHERREIYYRHGPSSLDHCAVIDGYISQWQTDQIIAGDNIITGYLAGIYHLLFALLAVAVAAAAAYLFGFPWRFGAG